MLSVRFELFVNENDLETNIEIVKAIAKAILENKAIITKTSIWKVSDDEMRKLFTSYY